MSDEELIAKLRSERFEGGISEWIATMREAADRIEALIAENARLREDFAKLHRGVDEVIASCEGCGAPLMCGDDYVSDEDGDCSGCWAAMTDFPAVSGRPCYAYRVGKKPAQGSAVLKDEQP